MAQTQITFSQASNKVEELRTRNEEFKTQMNNLETINGELMSMYEGEASKAFNTDFQNGKAQLQNFYNAIAQYAQVLQGMIDNYIRTEAANVELINTKK